MNDATHEEEIQRQIEGEAAGWAAIDAAIETLIAATIPYGLWGKGDGDGGLIISHLCAAAERAGVRPPPLISRSRSRTTVTRADGTVVVQQSARRRGPVASQLAREVFGRDGLCCRYCGYKHRSASKFDIDHIVPVTRGGCDEAENLVVSCKSCNGIKRTATWTPLSVVAAQSMRHPIPQWRMARNPPVVVP